MILLNSDSIIDRIKMESIPECGDSFPLACYQYNLRIRPEPWHWHREFETAVVESGTARVLLNGQEHLVHAGEGYFLNSAVLHSILSQREDGCVLRCMVFRKDLVEGVPGSIFAEKYTQPLLSNSGYQGIVLQKDVLWQRDILESIDRVFVACRWEKEGYENTVRGILTNILGGIVQNLPAEPDRPLSEKMEGYTAKIKMMLLYIWQHYADAIQLADIAASAGISGNNCMLCFRKTVGISPVQYLKNYRLQQAAKLLRESDRNIQEIVELCGFNDTSYFIRSFSDKYHMSPTKYRKMEPGE